MENVVEVKNLTHYYGQKLVYENLNFEIQNGRIFGLLGKNGTGKTTTINILNGFLKPKSGTCTIFGENSYKLSPATKARVGFLMEGHIQYSFMNINQIEKFYSAFYPNWRKEPYYELMSKLQVTENQKISKMSCGQKSQVALGLILAQNPDLLILDDYSMGLDAGYRRLFLDYLIDYSKSENKTVFITSHIIQDLDGFLEDCVIMDYNRILLSTSVIDFQNNFKKYTFKTNNPLSEINQDDVIKNFERIKNISTVYTFLNLDEFKKFLGDRNIEYENLSEISMDLEDAFIGLTGKY